MSTSKCNSASGITSQGGRVIKNSDGTISVYTLNSITQRLIPNPLTKICCDALSMQGVYFDTTTQKCRWTSSQAGFCDYKIPFDVVLNPVGNDGSIFTTNPDEVCNLDVEFDYLFKFSGDTLTKLANGQLTSECNRVIDVFESIGASMVINAIKPTQNGVQLQEIYTEEFFPKIGGGNLYIYLSGKPESGFYVTCNTVSGNEQQPINLYDLSISGTFLNCSTAINQLTQDLYTESALPQTTTGLTTFKQYISGNSFASNWKTFRTQISDQSIISGITNEKIKLNVRVTGACVDFCLLVDNIRLDKSCSYISNNSIFLSKSPGFDLDRVRDNKKSWLNNTSRVNRTHTIRKSDGSRPIRFTDYFVNDDRLAINSKEIDLDINIAEAIETDLWCYISDNPCILTGVSIGTTTCFKDVYSDVLTAITVYSNQITGTSATTSAITVTSITSTTVVSTITGFTCPKGYSATPANDQCQSVITSPATFNGSGNIIVAGNQIGVYGNAGTYFYPTVNLSTAALPYKYNNPATGNLVDANNTVILPTVINNNISNTFWFNPPSSTLGRLNSIALSAAGNSTPTIATDPNWLGFTQCLNLTQSGTYYIGLASDNYCRFFVNGTLVFEQTTALTAVFNKWSVFPIHLNSGLNFIRMEGLNNAGTLSAFGAEIYYPTGTTAFATLTAATSTASTQANVIFSTAQRIGTTWDNGTNIGYSCPANSNLNLCSPTPTCARLLTQSITVTSTSVSTTVTGYSYTTGTVYTKINLTGNVATLSAVTIQTCAPKTYCCSEYCGDANIDLKSLLTQPLNKIQTIEDFQYYLTTQLIDAKDRKTLSAYPTLRLLYDRYMNSLNHCPTISSKFDYYKMNKFASLIGNYWVDLIEQVVPATTIWGSTRIYRNTIFDEQKFKYKNSSLFFGQNPFTDPQVLSPATGRTCNTNTTTEVIFGNTSGSTLFNNIVNIKKYPYVYVVQMNSGSEFIGTVSNTQKSTTIVISDCNIKLVATPKSTYGTNSSNGSITIQVYNANNPLEFIWSNGATTPSINNLSAGTYTVTVTDIINKKCTTTASITIFEEPCTLSVSLNQVDPTPSQSNGSISAVVTGNYGSLTYAWSNGATTPSITGLSTGTYSLIVTDSKGCTSAASTVLYEIFSIKASNVTAATIYNVSATTSYNIDWGNGTVSAFTAGNNFLSQPNVYPTPYNGNINIRSLSLTGIKRILTNFFGPSGTTDPKLIITGPEISKLTALNHIQTIVRTHLSADTSELPRSLVTLTSYNGKLSGSLCNLPSGMTFINLTADEENILSGSTCCIPQTMQSFNVFGNNTITGNVSCIPSATTQFVISGFNTISGSTSDIPIGIRVMGFYGNAQLTGPIGGIPTGATSFVTQSLDNISGDVCGLSGHTNLETLFLENTEAALNAGTGNTVTGDINCLPKRISQLLIQGFNTISGDVANMVTGTTTGSSAFLGYFNLRGLNTLGGDINNASVNFSQFFLSGLNTVSGNTFDIPTNYRIFSVGGLNTITGDLAYAPTATTIFDVQGRNSVNTYSFKDWTSPDGLHSIIVTSSTVYNTGLTSTQLDNLLNDLTGYTWTNSATNSYVLRFGQPAITIRGTATTASEAARLKLSGSTGSGGFGVKITLI